MSRPDRHPDLPSTLFDQYTPIGYDEKGGAFCTDKGVLNLIDIEFISEDICALAIMIKHTNSNQYVTLGDAKNNGSFNFRYNTNFILPGPVSTENAKCVGSSKPFYLLRVDKTYCSNLTKKYWRLCIINGVNLKAGSYLFVIQQLAPKNYIPQVIQQSSCTIL